MVDIKNSDDLREWLKGKPREYSVVIASRIALRVLPIVGRIYSEDIDSITQNDLIKYNFFINLISWSAPNIPPNYMKLIEDAAHEANSIINAGKKTLNALIIFSSATSATMTAVRAAEVNHGFNAADAVNAAHVSVRDSKAAPHAIYAAISTDTNLIDQGMKPKSLAKQLLWQDVQPAGMNKRWQELKKNLLALNQDWDVWIDWYEDILVGRNWAGLPDDLVEKLAIKIASQTDDWWEQTPALVNADMKKWLDAARAEVKASSPSPDLPAEPEPQNAGAIRFSSIEGEPIGIYHSPDDVLLNDRNAIDRHSEVKSLASRLINSYDPNERGANSVTELIEDVKNYQVSLGESLKQTNIDFLIPRGDGLRMAFEAQKHIDDLSDLPPFSDKYKLSLEKLLSAHNLFVGLDPVLAKRDEARLGPDAKINLVPPAKGKAIIDDAVASGIAKKEVAEVLNEEAKVAPETPDAENRKSRRYSEGLKNFGRKIIADVTAWVSKNKGEVALGVGGVVVATAAVTAVATVGVGGTAVAGVIATYPLGKYMLKNEDWFLEAFSDKPTMLTLITKLYAILKKSPLK